MRGIFKHPALFKNDDIGNEMFEFMAKEMWKKKGIFALKHKV